MQLTSRSHRPNSPIQFSLLRTIARLVLTSALVSLASLADQNPVADTGKPPADAGKPPGLASSTGPGRSNIISERTEPVTRSESQQTQTRADAGPSSRTASSPEAGATNPPPTFADVPYGPHPRNVLDFWKAHSSRPAPVVVFIHGGGFRGGDKSLARRDPLVWEFLRRGVSFASINYRFLDQAPVQDILHDAARAIQFIRARSTDWNVDKRHIAAYGGSAGAGTALWLGVRDDLADPQQSDPVRRESSRLCAAGLFNPQASYDLLRWEEFLGPFRDEWLRSPQEIAEFYHLKDGGALQSPEGQRIRRECDMLHWFSADDAPVFAACSEADSPAQNRGHYLHHPAHVHEIEKHCRAAGIPCTVVLTRGEISRRDVLTQWFEFALKQLRSR